MSMIAGGDESARNAFRAILRDDSSRPLVAAATQELDVNDILEVKDLADAIERAERIIRTPLPSAPVVPDGSRPAVGPRDIFDVLATDDCAGPALHAPVRPTPVPPAPPVSARSAPAPAPAPAPSAPILYVHEEDAFMNPGGRIRSLADESLQIYRPEPTLLVRARTRRHTATWIAAGVLSLLAIVAGTAFLVSRAPAAPAAPALTAAAALPQTPAKAPPPPAVVVASPAVSPVPAAAAPVKAATPATTAAPATPAAPATDAVPVFDVKNLPPARRR